MKYLCYYDSIEHKSEERDYCLSATNKIDYIISVFNKIGINIDIISASRCRKTNTKGKNRVENIGEKNTLRLFKSTGGNKIIRIFDKIFHTLRFFFWNLKNIKKNETVICYHSLNYYKQIKLLKKIKKFKLILEVEEIYSDVTNNKKLRDKEIKYLNIADGYIFPTEVLNTKVNVNNKEFLILYGTYKVEKEIECKKNDDNIHLVYSGTLDPRKGGAITSVLITRYLPKNYHVHIIGFGSDEQIMKIEELIKDTNKKSKAYVSYDGLKYGKDYIQFLQSCDVGLSTQNPKANFNDTSFPSKILSYMANGLRVVSIDIPVIRNSKINEYIYYCLEYEPKKIANTITKIEYEKNYNSRKIIKKLDEEFTENLKKYIQNITKE